MTISNLTKTALSYPNGKKTLWEKEKLLVKSNFSFSLSVFKRLVSQGHRKVSLCGNGLRGYVQYRNMLLTSFSCEAHISRTYGNQVSIINCFQILTIAKISSLPVESSH